MGRACPGGPAAHCWVARPCAQHRPGRVSDKRPRHAGSLLTAAPRFNRLFHPSRFAGACRTMAERSSCEQREWRGLLFLRNPPALRGGRATRMGGPQPNGPAAHARGGRVARCWVARPCAPAPAGSRQRQEAAPCALIYAEPRFKSGSSRSYHDLSPRCAARPWALR